MLFRISKPISDASGGGRAWRHDGRRSRRARDRGHRDQPRSPAGGAASPGFATGPSVGFWYVLRVAQVAVVLQVGMGAHPAALGPRGQRPPLPLRGAAASRLAARRGGPRRRRRARAHRPRLRVAAEGPPAADRAGDRPPRDRDHGRLGAGHLPARAAGGGDDAGSLRCLRTP